MNQPPEQPSKPIQNDIPSSGEGVAHPQTETAGNVYSITTGISPGNSITATGTSIFGEPRPPGTDKENTDWYNKCTETLGFESFANNHGDHSSLGIMLNLSSSSRTTRICRVMRENSNLLDFPPLLSTLDGSGRPRFTYKKVWSDGRLSITMVESNETEMVRTIGDEGQLLLKILMSTERGVQRKEDEQEE